jgi:hypothetical protein
MHDSLGYIPTEFLLQTRAPVDTAAVQRSSFDLSSINPSALVSLSEGLPRAFQQSTTDIYHPR